MKVVLIGDAAVGKTSLLNRYFTGSHSNTIQPTLGAAFTTKDAVANGEKVRLQIWDTSGEERYRSMAPLYYRGADAVIIVYDVTNKASFDDVKLWMTQIRQHIPEGNAMIFLVGNKIDLEAEGLKQVTTEEVEAFASSINANFTEASAITGENVETIFNCVAAFNPTRKEPIDSQDLRSCEVESQKQKKSCC